MDAKGTHAKETVMGTLPMMESTPTGSSVAVLPDPQSLAAVAATIILEEARRAVSERGRFTIALSGGSTPQPIYRLLAGPSFSEMMPWEAIEVFWGDERCVEPGDPRSNEHMAREALLNHVPIGADRVHPIGCGAGEAAAQRAARDYEALLRSTFSDNSTAGIDLVLLGLGDNGHTASLFPGSEALDEWERWAVAALEDPGTAAATSGTGERLWRVTLTASFINRASLALFVVSGGAKAAVADAAIRRRGGYGELPALLIKPASGRLWWLLDQAAAAQFRAATPERPGGGAPEATSCQVDGVVESFDDLPECEGGPSR